MVIEYFLGGTLIVGIDEELRRVYVGHRGDGIFFDEPEEVVDVCFRKWNAISGHIVISKKDLAFLELKKE